MCFSKLYHSLLNASLWSLPSGTLILKIPMTEKPLIKALTEAGIGSRRRMAEAIKQGKVKVNGVTAESYNHPIDPGKDRVVFNGKTLDLKEEKIICLMLYKPAGIISTAADDKRRRTVLDILPPNYRRYRLYPVGRLDIDTTGLMLMTNDGNLTYKLTHPSFEYEKEYHAQVGGVLKTTEKDQFRHGILLEDGMTHAARISEINEPPYNYSVIIHEGKKRQVRRMFEHLRHPVLALKRVRIHNLTLGDLKEGDARPLTPKELAGLLK
jgi:23S rRNA pseudouridine2605 synthase